MTTLANLITRWRNKLDDGETPYGWTDAELTEYANLAIEELCRECFLIEDSTTASTCTYTVTDSEELVTVSDLIVRIKRAKLTSQSYKLPIHSVDHMDSEYPGWEAVSDAAPSVLIDEGTGENVVRLYPPPNASDTLNLIVYRLPVTELDSTDTTGTPEVSQKWQRFIDNGVYREAYAKHDEDTEAAKERERYAAKFENDKEQIKRQRIQADYKDRVVAPSLAFS